MCYIYSNNPTQDNHLLPTTSQSFEIPFTDQLHPTASELSSTSWLEVLSNTMSQCYGQDIIRNDNVIGFDILSGGTAMPSSTTFPRPEQGEDPVVTDAWRSLMTDSQIFGPGFKMGGL